MTIQSNAERQGAGAWQNLKAVYPERSVEFDELSAIEVGSADYLIRSYHCWRIKP